MDYENRKARAREAGLTWRGDELDALPESELRAGYVKFNIPKPETPECPNGEGVWGWADPDSKAKYDDDSYHGKLTVILCNDPVQYDDILCSGTEVVIQCNGENRPILDPEWVREKLVDSGLYTLPEEKEEETPPERSILLAALETWGPEMQTMITLEEMGELQKELSKHFRGTNNREAIAEEIADVEIMLEQMKILHDCGPLADIFRAEKLERLARRILEAQKEPVLPELANYSHRDHTWFISGANEDWDGENSNHGFKVVFDVGNVGNFRYHCYVKAESEAEALGVFFKAHPHVTYGMVRDCMEVGR